MGWTDESWERCCALVGELSELLADGLESQPAPPEAREGNPQAAEEKAWVNYIREEEEDARSYEAEQRLTHISLEHRRMADEDRFYDRFYK